MQALCALAKKAEFPFHSLAKPTLGKRRFLAARGSWFCQNDPARLAASISSILVAMRIFPSARASRRFRAVSSSPVLRLA